MKQSLPGRGDHCVFVVYTVYFQEEAPASRKRKTKKGLKALLRRMTGDEDACRRNRAIASVLAVL